MSSVSVWGTHVGNFWQLSLMWSSSAVDEAALQYITTKKQKKKITFWTQYSFVSVHLLPYISNRNCLSSFCQRMSFFSLFFQFLVDNFFLCISKSLILRIAGTNYIKGLLALLITIWFCVICDIFPAVIYLNSTNLSSKQKGAITCLPPGVLTEIVR